MRAIRNEMKGEKKKDAFVFIGTDIILTLKLPG